MTESVGTAIAVTSNREPGELRVKSGSITMLGLFDVAFAIDLARVEALWARQARPASSRLRFSATPPKAVAFGVPPVALILDTLDLDLEGGETVTAIVTARIYDFGVVTLAVRVGGAGLTWAEYSRLLNRVDRALGAESESPLWSRLLESLTEPLHEALIRPARSTLREDYLFGVVHSFSEPMPAAALVDTVDLVPLLTGEQRPLSPGARHDLLSHRFSYYEDDLVVLAWDRAFIYEPRGDSDVADVLEVANAQLLEMRYYDELLDAELPRMYALVQDARRHWNLFAPRRYADLARRLYRLVAEVTELTEKVDNALQVTEDVYLARIYAEALDLYRVPTVSAAVDRKLAIIRDTYAALYDEASSSRAGLMEMSVIILILVEIVLALIH
ncbi:MAG TPA: hypothetical protein VMI52_02300 [Acetobacteraceae bacterium]|nr:hypothetical protein [Acetobacteraceae bacterium]